MKVLKEILKDCLVIMPEIHIDNRGIFLETFQAEKYRSIAGINYTFVQDNCSHSSFNVLRGLHFQKNRPQGKLVRVTKGKVFDVVVDIRRDSPMFGKWSSVILSDKNMHQLWIPPGFAHGFITLSSIAILEYKCTEYYDPKDEGSLLWNDVNIGIKWPNNEPIMSTKDANANSFLELPF